MSTCRETPRRRAEMETRWAAIIVGLAHLGALHQSERRLGVALADAGFSELRFARLLRADADRLVDELPTARAFSCGQGCAGRLDRGGATHPLGGSAERGTTLVATWRATTTARWPARRTLEL